MSITMQLNDAVLVVTGGASGIGFATARIAEKQGVRVAVIDCDQEKLNAAPGSLKILCDVTDVEQVRLAFEEIGQAFGRVDALVNSAGVAMREPVHEHDEKTWRRVIEVNLTGLFLTSKYAISHFPDQGGAIVHIASVTGIIGTRNRAAYTATKGAIVALTRNMALDYASRRIRVNCVCPGFVKTPLISAILADPQRTALVTSLHPLGRLGEPEDVAQTVLFLASDAASWITGQSFVVDGGFSAGHSAEI